MKIEDGRGTGLIAQVDGEHRLATKSVTSDEQVVSNIESGEAFNAATGTFSVPTGDDHRIFYFKNVNATRSVVIDGYTVSHSGGAAGDTNINQRFFVGASAPTANNVARVVNALNTKSPVTPEVEFEVWDGVGTGITTLQEGVSFGDQHFARGFQQVESLSKIVIGPGGVLTSNILTPGTTNVSMSIQFHFLMENEGI